jgi:hypothetical protein
MSDTPIKSVTLPSGGSAELKEFLTAGEFLDINEAPNGQELSKKQLAKKVLDLAVVSLNGVKEDIPNLLRALALPDYIFLSKEIAKIIEGDFTSAKTSQ